MEVDVGIDHGLAARLARSAFGLGSELEVDGHASLVVDPADKCQWNRIDIDLFASVDLTRHAQRVHIAAGIGPP